MKLPSKKDLEVTFLTRYSEIDTFPHVMVILIYLKIEKQANSITFLLHCICLHILVHNQIVDNVEKEYLYSYVLGITH